MVSVTHISESKYKMNRLFAFWFATSFILNGYASGISGISLGSICYVFMIISVVFFSSRGRIPVIIDQITVFTIVFISVSFFGMLLLYISGNGSISVRNVVVSIMKFLTWTCMCSCVAKKRFELGTISKWLVRIAIVLTAYLILQTVAYYIFSIYLPNIFDVGLLRPYDQGYADYDRLMSTSILRPASLLSESSFYGNYALCSFVIYFENNVERIGKKQLTFGVFLSIGIVLSGSTSAIVMLLIVWIIELWRLKVHTRAIVFLAIALLLLVFFYTGLLSQVLSSESVVGRILSYSFEKFTYLQDSPRVGKSFAYLNLFDRTDLIFGVGIGNEIAAIRARTSVDTVYLNSVTSLLLQGGYVGCGMFFLMVLSLSKKAIKQKNTSAVLLLFIYTIKGFASGIYFSTYGILFMFLIIGLLNADDERYRGCA